ncbi:hypothetical protein BU17DRAFT_69155 [Hysterangium stoloniferum]|nr:hypothetical protein BU17DRAFT_69155 [Hysterangium stoloniferum]
MNNFLLVFLALATLSSSRVAAQATFNSLNQSPCLVTAFLRQACLGTRLVNVPPLSPGNEYIGPQPGQSDTCGCSSVTYSMISACALCQGGQYMTFPPTIPVGVSIPSWAYLNVTTTGTFDSTAASNNHTASTSPGSSSPPSASHKKSNAGAIAGGVIGGLIGFALIAGAGFFIYRRRQGGRVMTTNEWEQTPSSEKHYATNGGAQMAMVMHPPLQPGILYNPDDPSTFPSSPGPTLPTYTSPTITTVSLLQDPNHSSHGRQLSDGTSHITPFSPTSTGNGRNSPAPFNPPALGGYTGVPEI